MSKSGHIYLKYWSDVYCTLLRVTATGLAPGLWNWNLVGSTDSNQVRRISNYKLWWLIGEQLTVQ